MAPADSHNRAASASPWHGFARPQAAWRSRRRDSSPSHGLRNHHCRPPAVICVLGDHGHLEVDYKLSAHVLLAKAGLLEVDEAGELSSWE